MELMSYEELKEKIEEHKNIPRDVKKIPTWEG